MVKFIIVRHGYSISNKANIFTGQRDVPLDEFGHHQAKELAEYLLKTYKIDKIYSSDLKRAYDTAKPIADILNIPIKKEMLLREIDVGNWAGKTFEEIKERYPKTAQRYMQNVPIRFDGGENYEETQKRGLAIIQRIAEVNEGKTILVATHAGMIRTLLCAFLKTSIEHVRDLPSIPNASITTATYENGEFFLGKIGNCEYLSNKMERVGFLKQ